MSADELENGAQYCFSKFVCRLFISKFSQSEFYLSLLLSVISKSLAKLCSKCCNLSVSIVLNVRFTMSRMFLRNNTHRIVVQTCTNTMSTTWDFYCCLLTQCEFCALAARHLQSPQSGALTWIWEWWQVQPSQEEREIGAVHCKKGGCCCNFSVGVALKVWFTTNGMRTKSKKQIYVTWTSNNRVIS